MVVIKQSYKLIVTRLLLVLLSISRLASIIRLEEISRLVSRFRMNGFFKLKESHIDRAGFVTQISIVLFAVTTLYVSGLSYFPLEREALVETILEAPSNVEVFLTEPETSKYQLPQIEPMRLFTVSSEFDKIIIRISREFDVDPALVKAVIHSESAFDQFAVSSQGATGLMQLMPATSERFAVEDPYNAEQNIRGGVRFLKHLLTTFENDERLAIAAYNAGPGRVLYYGNVPPFIETYTFVYKVLGLRKLYADAYPATQDKMGTPTALPEASIST